MALSVDIVLIILKQSGIFSLEYAITILAEVIVFIYSLDISLLFSWIFSTISNASNFEINLLLIFSFLFTN